MKSTHGGVLFLVNLQAKACSFTKSNTPRYYLWIWSQEIADLVTFAEEILSGKLHFLCSAWTKNRIRAS